MRTVAEIQTYVMDIFNESSTKIQTTIQRAFTTIYQELRNDLSIFYDIDSEADTTVAQQAVYTLPVRYRKMVQVKVTVGGDPYYPIPIASRDQFNKLKEGVGSSPYSDFPLYYFLHAQVGKYQIEFYPAPSSSGNAIEYRFYENPRDIVSADFTDKTAGTVSVSNGSASVTGSGTAFASSDVGRYIRFDSDGHWYRISAVGGTTSLTLDRNYEGTAISGGNYKLGTVLQIPAEANKIIARKILQELWEKREDATISGGKASYYEDRAEKAKKALIKNIEEMYDSPDVNSLDLHDRFINPNDFPTASA